MTHSPTSSSLPTTSNCLNRVHPDSLASGLISAMLVMTGPAILVLQAAHGAGLSQSETVAWVFIVYVMGGLFSIVLPLWLRIPVAGAHSLTGAAFLVSVAPHYSYPELIGGFVLSALLILFVGATGLYARLMALVPTTVISSMLAGLIAVYIVRMVDSAVALPVVGGLALLGYLLLVRFGKKVPPILGALVLGLIGVWWFAPNRGSAMIIGGFAWPTLHMPVISGPIFVSVAIPLAVLILSNDVTPALGALEAFGFHPPVRTLVTASGVASLMTAFLGGHCTNIAGMMTAICSEESAGPRSTRFVAAATSGAITALFGMCAFAVVPFISGLPGPFVAVLAGLALIGAFGSALKTAFQSDKHRLSAVLTFAIAFSNITFLHVSAAVWALVLGVLVARVLERA